VVLCVFSALQLQAQKATCTNWHIWSLNPASPSNPGAFAADVNDNRTVVGTATFSGKGWGFVHYSSGKVTYWRPANAYYSDFSGRNNWGNTVGNYEDTLNVHHAVYFHGSTTTLIVHPKAAHHNTFVMDINNLNTILGKYWDSTGVSRIFKRRSNGTFLSVPSFQAHKTLLRSPSMTTAWSSVPISWPTTSTWSLTDSSIATEASRL
jgi:hypothetical protein